MIGTYCQNNNRKTGFIMNLDVFFISALTFAIDVAKVNDLAKIDISRFNEF